jgi:hypothetical protein
MMSRMRAPSSPRRIRACSASNPAECRSPRPDSTLCQSGSRAVTAATGLWMKWSTLTSCSPTAGPPTLDAEPRTAAAAHPPGCVWQCRDRRGPGTSGMQNGRLRAGQSMLRTRPRAGHPVISEVGCLRETRSDHHGSGRPAGYPGRGVASHPGVPGWSRPTSRRPARTPVRDRWQRRLASGSRSWLVSRAARFSHVSGPL